MKRLNSSYPHSLVILLLLCWSSGCTQLSTPTPTPHPIMQLDARTLLLDIKSFPVGWIISPCEPYCLETRHASDTVRTFVIPQKPGQVSQQVQRFPSIDAAQNAYNRAYQSLHGTPLSHVQYASPYAESSSLTCGGDVVPSCQALFRYEHYVIDFYFTIDDGINGGLNYPDIIPILQAMDQRAAQ